LIRSIVLGRANIGLFVVRAAALYAALAMSPASAVASTQILDYEVDHPWLGKIGTYVNAIVRQGPRTTVTSSLRVVASILGIVVHRQYADRIELWQDGRIVYFDGVTTVNGKAFPVHGEAQGSTFVVTSPDGAAIAPADVYPNNPWSCAFVHGTTIFAVNTGTVEPGQVTGGEPATLDIDGKSLWTRHYRVESARTHANVWLNQQCVPVRMDVVISDTNISLVLTGETNEP
jgi:Family of unknown function (DUF6134)